MADEVGADDSGHVIVPAFDYPVQRLDVSLNIQRPVPMPDG
jgi:hypothetical protein